ncbi:MAG: hypothetical protein ACFFA5_06420 [Promethearchaeota archaeon]
MTEAIITTSTEVTQEDLQKLYKKQTDLIAEKIKSELIIGDILHAFDTREALEWEKAKKIAKMELLNKYILQYNQVRRQLIEVNKTIRALEGQTQN